MNDSKNVDNSSLTIKIIQSGDIIRVKLTRDNLQKNFKDIYHSLLKELKLKLKDAYLSNGEGKMIGAFDLNLSLKEIIQKFGTKLKLYYEKIL